MEAIHQKKKNNELIPEFNKPTIVNHSKNGFRTTKEDEVARKQSQNKFQVDIASDIFTALKGKRTLIAKKVNFLDKINSSARSYKH